MMSPLSSSEEEEAVTSPTTEPSLVSDGPPCMPLAPGNYKLVTWDLDTTGRRLLDEMCHIGAYAGNENVFSQYVMPFRDPNPGSVRRHFLRVINTERYRMLKNIKSGKLLRTKSEVSSITDFLNWLDQVRGDCDGVVLVFYEPRAVISLMLLQAVEKYDLMKPFCAVVKGFVNGYEVAQQQCARSIRSFSLRNMAKIFLGLEGIERPFLRRFKGGVVKTSDQVEQNGSTEQHDENGGGDKKTETEGEENDQMSKHDGGGEKIPAAEEDNRMDSASSRARLIYEVLEKVVEEEPLTFAHVQEMSNDVDWELKNLEALRMVLSKHSTLRPLFEAQLREGRRERQRATNLRRQLAEAGVDYDLVLHHHNVSGLEGMKGWLTEKVSQLKPRDVEELVTLMEKHFSTASGGDGDKADATNAKKESNRPANPKRRRSLRNSTSDNRKNSMGTIQEEKNGKEKNTDKQGQGEEAVRVVTVSPPEEEQKEDGGSVTPPVAVAVAE